MPIGKKRYGMIHRRLGGMSHGFMAGRTVIWAAVWFLIFTARHRGKPAPSLQQVLQSGLSNEQLDRALIELTQFLNTTDVWMRHPGPANIVLAADGRLKLIDCLGTYNMSYVVHHFSVLRRRRQVRHISYLHGAVTRMRQSAPLTAE